MCLFQSHKQGLPDASIVDKITYQWLVHVKMYGFYCEIIDAVKSGLNQNILLLNILTVINTQ